MRSSAWPVNRRAARYVFSCVQLTRDERLDHFARAVGPRLWRRHPFVFATLEHVTGPPRGVRDVSVTRLLLEEVIDQPLDVFLDCVSCARVSLVFGHIVPGVSLAGRFRATRE